MDSAPEQATLPQARFRHDLGWAARIPLPEGVSETILSRWPAAARQWN